MEKTLKLKSKHQQQMQILYDTLPIKMSEDCGNGWYRITIRCNEEQENLIESCKTPLDLAAVYYQTHKQGTYWRKYYERVYMLIEIIENF